MPYFASPAAFYDTMQKFFEVMRAQEPNPVDTLVKQRISIQFTVREPNALIALNARRKPLEITFGEAVKFRPELSVQVQADALHKSLLDELSLTPAIANQEMKVSGPIFKTFSLKEILDQGRKLYPQIISEQSQ